MQTAIISKGQLFCFGTQSPSPPRWKYWLRDGAMQSVALKPDGQRSDLYAESRASYKYWKKDAVGERERPKAAFEKWPTWAPHQISSPPVRIYPIWSE